MSDFDFAGKTVLVTGGSMGIGEVLARELDRLGARLVLVARSAEKLALVAASLRDATWIAADLGEAGSVARVVGDLQAREITIDVLINNAGFGAPGAFDAIASSTQRDMVNLNVGAIVELTHALLPEIERRHGGVIFVASVAGYVPVPWMATYGATKAFVLSFGEALWAEYRQRGVRIFTLSPGATDTPFFARSGEAASAGNKKAPPEDVVRLGLRAFARTDAPSVVHGFANGLLTLVVRFFSRAFVARATARITASKPRVLSRGTA